ncbi:MAG TPA: DUF2510 domain-containing protein [Candidatus Dormibacteraeota bacterium]
MYSILWIPILFSLIWLAAFVYWIVAIVEVARTPDWQFKAIGSEKLVWLLLVIFLGVIGALVWLFAKRSTVLAAAHSVPPPPPPAGWYPEPGAGSLRWWDGVRWSDARHFPPPPA